MFVISTRNYPPEIGGMQNLMGGLANALINHGPVKVFADKSENLPTLQTLPFFRQENRPEDFTKEFPMMKFEEKKPLNLMPQEVPMSPELLMVMNSLNNMGGIMATPMRKETGLAALANMTYGDRGKIPV